jgi:hypothetical protein
MGKSFLNFLLTDVTQLNEILIVSAISWQGNIKVFGLRVRNISK